MANTILNIFTFHDNTTTVSNGQELRINCGSIMNLDIQGTGTAIINFEGCSNDDNNFRPIMSVNLSTYDMATSTNNLASLWQVSVEGLIKFRARISEITGVVKVIGTVTG
jgi:hypothetical protein